MNCVVLLLCVTFLGTLAHHLPQSEKDKLKQIHDACQANPDTHVDESLLKKLPQNAENQKVGSHLFCMAVKAGLLTQDGELIRDVIKSKIALVTHDVSQVDGLLKKCAVKYETPEKTSVQLLLCFVQNNIHYHHDI